MSADNVSKILSADNVSLKYKDIVSMLLHVKCECGQPVAVKHGDEVFCAGCWMDKYGPAKHHIKTT